MTLHTLRPLLKDEATRGHDDPEPLLLPLVGRCQGSAAWEAGYGLLMLDARDGGKDEAQRS